MKITQAKKVFKSLKIILSYDIDSLFKVKENEVFNISSNSDLSVISNALSINDSNILKKFLHILQESINSFKICDENIINIEKIFNVTENNSNLFLDYCKSILNSMTIKDDEDIINCIGFIGIKVVSDDTTYSITNTLTSVTSSNSLTTIGDSESYSATLTAEEGKTLGAITVTMGGTNISSSVVSNNVINISKVTGNLVITASAA